MSENKTNTSVSPEKWVLLKKKRPSKAGEYRIKNDQMDGYGYFSGGGWNVFGDWDGNITHWAKPSCH